jgi:hypothetical protein
MSNKQQTAVEWFHHKTLNLKIQLELADISIGEYLSTYSALYKQAKEMEKLRMILFACDVHMDIKKDRVKSLMELVEEMYNETYGGN